MSIAPSACGLVEHFLAFTAWLKEWQTLVSGVLAVAAAGIGAIYLSRQTRASFSIHNDQIRRSHNAAKLLMIPQLTQLGLGISRAHVLIAQLSKAAEEYQDDLEIFATIEGFDDYEDNTFENYENKLDKISEQISNFHLVNLEQFLESLNSNKKLSHLNELLSQLNDLSIKLLGLKSTTLKGPKFFDDDEASDLIITCSKCAISINSIQSYCRNDESSKFPINLSKNYEHYWNTILNHHNRTLEIVNPTYKLRELLLEKIQYLLDNNASPWLTNEIQ